MEQDKIEEEINASDFKDTIQDGDDSVIEVNDSISEDSSVSKKKKNKDKKDTETKGSILRDIIVYVIIIVLCLTVVPNYVIRRTEVDGSSMRNTLSNYDNLLVEKISYRFKDPERFDIITFYPYGRDDEEDYYIKRIIGLPGEEIQITGDTIYINGKVLEENYGREPMEDDGIAAEPIKLGKDEYFVLGDNRNHSFDSREEAVGTVKRSEIDGRAIFRLCSFKTKEDGERGSVSFSKFGTIK